MQDLHPLRALALWCTPADRAPSGRRRVGIDLRRRAAPLMGHL